MKILVTGGAGYIGSHTVKELIEEEFDVVVFDNFSTGHRELICGGKVIEGDLRGKNSLEKVFKENSIQAVLHFASQTIVEESCQDPQKYYTGNLLAALNLLNTMLTAGVKKFIFSSSAAVYGTPEHIPILEKHPSRPINPYGQTKFFIETILKDYSRAYGLSFISLRYFNAAGADPEGRLGEMHDPETHLIPNIMQSLLHEDKKLEIFGTDFPTPDGTAIRDYIHVKDLAIAHVLSLKKILKSPMAEFVNLGSNKGYSVKEIIKTIESVTGKKVSSTIRPKRIGDPPILLASIEKAQQMLGWKTQHTDITTIIETAWNWHLKKRKGNPLKTA